MNFVEPIRDPKVVEDIANYFKKTNMRNYIMYMAGIYIGLRISDILQLRVKDVRGKKQINIREQKTGKQKLIKINPELQKPFEEYIKDKDDDEYLVKSRQNYNQPIGRSMAYKILRTTAEKFGIECIGTHTLRKTFGYHFYKKNKDVVTLMRMFNHSHQSITLRYIGIEQEEIDDAMNRFKIF